MEEDAGDVTLCVAVLSEHNMESEGSFAVAFRIDSGSE